MVKFVEPPLDKSATIALTQLFESNISPSFKFLLDRSNTHSSVFSVSFFLNGESGGVNEALGSWTPIISIIN